MDGKIIAKKLHKAPNAFLVNVPNCFTYTVKINNIDSIFNIYIYSTFKFDFLFWKYRFFVFLYLKNIELKSIFFYIILESILYIFIFECVLQFAQFIVINHLQHERVFILINIYLKNIQLLPLFNILNIYRIHFMMLRWIICFFFKRY
jgi:hypothetical protein